MGSIQSQHGLRSQNANRMLTLFRKICFDGKNSQSLVPTVKTPETPVKSRVSGVLKGAEKRSKCSKRHPLPRTRNQFGSNPTRVRIPPAAPARRKRHIACGELFHFITKLIARSLKLLPASKPNPLRGGCAPRRACGYSAQFPSVGPHCPDMQDFTVFLHAQGGISWESVPAGKFHLLNRFLDFRVVFACFCLAQFIFIRSYLNKIFPADPCFL